MESACEWDFLEFGFLRDDNGNVESRRSGYAYLSFISATFSLET